VEKLLEQALQLLDEGLLPADLSNIYIFIKIISFIGLLVVFSGGLGFYLGLTTALVTH